MPVDRDSVLALAPELSLVPTDDGRWTLAFALAKEFTDETRLGTSRYELAGNLFVAHFLTLAEEDGVVVDANAPAGPLTSEKYGDVSKTYAAPSSAAAAGGGTPREAEFRRTSYGAAFIALVKPSGAGGVVL